MPTLKQLAALSPEVIALANDSVNFRISEVIQRAGFTNILPVYERRKLPLTSTIKVTRYPTAGIDNMLVIETPEGTILNYNDRHLPIDALRLLMRKIGKVDVLLNSFNHAIKQINNTYPESFVSLFIDGKAPESPKVGPLCASYRRDKIPVE